MQWTLGADRNAVDRVARCRSPHCRAERSAASRYRWSSPCRTGETIRTSPRIRAAVGPQLGQPMSLTAHARLRLGRSDVHGRLADYFQAGHRWLAYQSAYQPIRSWPIKPVLERTLPTLAGHVLGSTTLADTEEVTGSNPVSPTSTEHAALGNLRGDDKARLGAVVPDGTNRQGPPAQIAEEVLSGRGVDFASAVPAQGLDQCHLVGGRVRNTGGADSGSCGLAPRGWTGGVSSRAGGLSRDH
jgi:hypothetical protein